jgi:sulfite exporter TauE/SafE
MIYAPLAVAMTTGSPLHGATVMAALGFGTMPLMFFFGTAATTIPNKTRTGLFRIMGFIVILMGLYGLWKLLVK